MQLTWICCKSHTNRLRTVCASQYSRGAESLKQKNYEKKFGHKSQGGAIGPCVCESTQESRNGQNISCLEITKKKYLAQKMKFESQIGTKTVYQPLSFYSINFYLIWSFWLGHNKRVDVQWQLDKAQTYQITNSTCSRMSV